MSKPVIRWWRGALDVEGFALDAVRHARDAVADLCTHSGSSREVSTTPELVAASFAAIEHLRVDGRVPEGWAPLSGFVQAADGWVRLHANYPHHAAAITRALGATTRDELTAAVAPMTAEAVEACVSQARGIATTVRSEAEWNAHPHAVATACDPWYTEELADHRAALAPGEMPLAGVKVLDLTRVIAGPSCSQLLACLGAEVLRLDPPQRPELLDQYLSNGMGKRSAEIDLRDRAEHVQRSLLPQADVVLTGYRPGSLAKHGLDPNSIIEQDPSLIVASLSAWGEHGPWGERAGFDSIVQAATGIAESCGTETRPGALPVQALDHATGYVLAGRIISLLARGRGGVTHASLLGAARTLLARPRKWIDQAVELEIPTVRVESPYGMLSAVPPPLMLDGRTLERPVTRYGSSPVEWA